MRPLTSCFAIETLRRPPQGKHLGRPKIDAGTENAIRAALSKKNRVGIRKIAQRIGCGTGPVQRVQRELEIA